MDVCPQGAVLSAGKIDRTRCTTCGKCAEACPTAALVVQGYSVTEEMLFQRVTKEKAFYRDGGGVTFSGGECLLQSEFCAKVLR